MEIFNIRQSKEIAAQRLEHWAEQPKRLALIHSAVALGSTLLVTLLQYVLNLQIGDTGGLAGLGTRSVLETVRTVLQYAVNIGLPFWEMGFVFVMLRLIRQEKSGVRDMTEGFHRFGPVLRLYLLQGLIYFGVALLCANVASVIYSFTPWSAGATELLMPMLSENTTVDQVQEIILTLPMEQLLELLLPVLLITGTLVLVLFVHLSYRFRMASFLVMDQPGTGAVAALILSNRMTKGCRWKLLKLDLSFWWYYGLSLVAAVVMYADILLALLGIPLPVSAEVAWFAAYIAGCLVQLVVFWQYNSYVQGTYTVVYDTLLEKLKAQLTPAPESF